MLLWLGFNVKIALWSGIVTSNLVNFLFDRHWVFAYARDKHLLGQLLGFILVVATGATLNYAISIWLLRQYAKLLPQIAAIGGISTAVIFNYVCLRYLVFREPI